MIISRTSLLASVRQYAKLQATKDFGWKHILEEYNDAELLYMFTQFDVFDIPTAIDAVQNVVDALNND
jgi:hypothetical protein